MALPQVLSYRKRSRQLDEGWYTIAQIETLVEDIENLLKTGTVIEDVMAEKFSTSMFDTIKKALDRERKGSLRMSNIGTACERKLWYGVNEPEAAEELTADTYMKFLTGHLLEETVLFLAELAGHEVLGRQDTQDLFGVKGHRDAVIDGVIVDVKSASHYSFLKFQAGKLSEDDSFGYIPQLMGYLEAGQNDPLVTEKNKAAFLVIHKEKGLLCLDWHNRPDWNWEEVVTHKKDLVNSDVTPDRDYHPVEDGKSGNMKLPMYCGYCDFKKHCHPGLRTFLYSDKPRFLTKVVNEPKVSEVI